MVRGGKRNNAGRKSTWVSGVKFEETTLIRVPNYVKDRLLEIAHRLDAGESIDFASNSEKQDFEEISLRVIALELENRCLHEELKNYSLDLDTKSEETGLKIRKLEEENEFLKSQLFSNNLDSNSSLNDFLDFISKFIEDWRKQLVKLRPIDASTKAHQMLVELQKIVSEKKLLALESIPPNDNPIQPNLELETKSNFDDNEVVTNSKEVVEILSKPEQLSLLEMESIKSAGSNALNQSALAKRLGVHPPNLAKARNHSEEKLAVYSSSNDPDKIAWRYSKEEKLYYPIN